MKATMNGITVHYIEQGTSQSLHLAFLHGFPFSHKMWQPQLKALPEGFHSVTYDIRGHGSSEVGDGQYTIDLFVDDLIALLDHLSIEKAILCGLSMGGYIALRAIEKFPERIKGLILCDTKSESDTNETKTKRAATIKAIKVFGVQKFANDFVKSIFYEKTFETNPDIVKLITNIICENSPLGICGTVLALASRTDTTNILSSLHVPTCIIVGEQDALTPPTVAKNMNKAIPLSELHIIPSAGHMTNLENTVAFNDTLIAFLKKHWYP